jgi:hypothetical protein
VIQSNPIDLNKANNNNSNNHDNKEPSKAVFQLNMKISDLPPKLEDEEPKLGAAKP